MTLKWEEFLAPLNHYPMLMRPDWGKCNPWFPARNQNKKWSLLLLQKNYKQLHPDISEEAACDPGQSTVVRAHEAGFYNFRVKLFQLCSKTNALVNKQNGCRDMKVSPALCARREPKGNPEVLSKDSQQMLPKQKI